MEVKLSDEFTTSVREKVYSEKIFDQVFKMVKKTIPIVPTIGTNSLPASIAEAFGAEVRIASVKPFLIVYEYDKDHEIVSVYDLIHGKQAY